MRKDIRSIAVFGCATVVSATTWAHLSARPTFVVRQPENVQYTDELLGILGDAATATATEALAPIVKEMVPRLQSYVLNPSNPDAINPSQFKVEKPLQKMLGYASRFQKEVVTKLKSFRDVRMANNEGDVDLYLGLVPYPVDKANELRAYPDFKKPQAFANTFLGPIIGDVDHTARILPTEVTDQRGNAVYTLEALKIRQHAIRGLKSDMLERYPFKREPTQPEHVFEKLFYFVDAHQPIASELHLHMSKKEGKSFLRSSIVVPPIGLPIAKVRGSKNASDYTIEPIVLRMKTKDYMETDMATVTSFSYQNPIRPLRSNPLYPTLGSVIKIEMEKNLDVDNEILVTTHFGRLMESSEQRGLMPTQINMADIQSSALGSLPTEYPDALMADGYLHWAQGNDSSEKVRLLNSLVLNHLQFRIQIRKLAIRMKFKTQMISNVPTVVFDKAIVDRDLSDIGIQLIFQSQQEDRTLNAGISGPGSSSGSFTSLNIFDRIDCDEYGDGIYLRNPRYILNYLEQRRCFTKNPNLQPMPKAIKALLTNRFTGLLQCTNAGSGADMLVSYNCHRNFAKESDLAKDFIGKLVNDRAFKAATDGVGGNVEERIAGMQKNVDESLSKALDQIVEVMMAPRNMLSDMGLAQ